MDFLLDPLPASGYSLPRYREGDTDTMDIAQTAENIKRHQQAVHKAIMTAPRNINLSTIARRAGVCSATMTNIMRHPERMSMLTLEKINFALRDLGIAIDATTPQPRQKSRKPSKRTIKRAART